MRPHFNALVSCNNDILPSCIPYRDKKENHRRPLGHPPSMTEDPTPSSLWCTVAIVSSLVLAFSGWYAPQWRMPLDFHSMLWWSLPLAGLWPVMVGISAFLFRKKAFWLLLGAPLALYWPVWLLLKGIPPCYWHGNCV